MITTVTRVSLPLKKPYPERARLVGHRKQCRTGVIVRDEGDIARRLHTHDRVLYRTIGTCTKRRPHRRARRIKLVVDRAAAASGTGGIKVVTTLSASAAAGGQGVVNEASCSHGRSAGGRPAQRR